MWVLFGTKYDINQNINYSYFIGIYESFEMANNEKNILILRKNNSRSDYVIKMVDINKSYDYKWSNEDYN